MNVISNIILPIFVLLIIGYGVKKKVNIYDSFLVGAKDGLITVFNIVPAIVGMVFAINLFLNSNFVEFLLGFTRPFFNFLHVPLETVPMAILRPISGSATLSILTEVMRKYGPDSYIGNLSSVIQGCTDTTVYVIALYYSSIKVSKIRYSLWVGLIADAAGIIMAYILASMFFS